MSNNFEEHIRKNKAAFDEFEPSEALWHRIDRELGNPPARVVKFSFRQLAVAAAIAGLLFLSGWFLLTKDGDLQPEGNLSAVETPVSDSPAERTEDFVAARIDTVVPADEKPGSPVEKPRMNTAANDKYLVNHVETEQIIGAYKTKINEQYKLLSVLRENEPLLYKKFTYDLQELDSNYRVLKVKSQKVANNEQLINAMIENLQLQTELLQKQLYIIKTLKSEKNETEYKTL